MQEALNSIPAPSKTKQNKTKHKQTNKQTNKKQKTKKQVPEGTDMVVHNYNSSSQESQNGRSQIQG